MLRAQRGVCPILRACAKRSAPGRSLRQMELHGLIKACPDGFGQDAAVVWIVPKRADPDCPVADTDKALERAKAAQLENRAVSYRKTGSSERKKVSSSCCLATGKSGSCVAGKPVAKPVHLATGKPRNRIREQSLSLKRSIEKDAIPGRGKSLFFLNDNDPNDRSKAGTAEPVPCHRHGCPARGRPRTPPERPPIPHGHPWSPGPSSA